MSFKHGLLAALALFFAGVGAAQAEPYRIVGLGDSLMAGYGLGPGESIPEQLETRLRAAGHDVLISNAGVSGDTSSGGAARLDWSVPEGTNLVLLELGSNDMLRGVTPDITEKNLDGMLAALKARGVAVLLVGMRAAPNLGADYVAAFEAIFPRLAEKHGVPLYPFFMDGVAADAALLQSDGMHPNAKGAAIMAERILPVVEQIVGAATPTE
ncbi:MAG: arylesterase [Rhizobiaceae bacterium]